MFSSFRIFGLAPIIIGLVVIFGCSKDKTTTSTSNHPPVAPFNPSPANDATGIGIISVTLRWHCSDQDNDTIKYDVYFDTLSNPGLVASSQLDSTYDLDSMGVSRDYYWKIVARDEHGSETASPVWHFSTMPGPEQIIFESDRDQDHYMYMMNADGSNVRDIGDSLVMGIHPSFSNDGSKIVFEHFIGQFVRINTINSNRSELFEVTHENLYTGPPVWSPNMNQIAFLVFSDTGNFRAALYIVNANGENLHAITNYNIPEESWRISWSPDGNKIAFENDSVGYINCSIYTINTDGTNVQQLTSHSNYDRDPAWSHDGTMIAFSRHVVAENNRMDQIFVMNSDGSNQHNITNTLTNERVPCWSPDDSQIAFASERDGNLEIYIMNANGSNQHNITNNPALDIDPSWAPWHR